ncbi:MAG: PqiC family protein [Shimia sp.]
MTLRLLPLALAALLAACATPDIRIRAEAPAPERSIGIRYSALEVALVTLPAYAEDEQIIVEGEGGALSPLGPLWADTPARAVTLDISRDLAALTGAIVAPEPWPFRDFPDAKIDIRVSDFLATQAGTFRIAGQYFVAPETDGTPRARTFSVEAPLTEATPLGLVSARNAAVRDLAQEIARDGLR